MKKKDLIDQPAHFIAACLILAPVLIHPGVITAAFAGLAIGLVRELTEDSKKVSLGAFKRVVQSRSSMLDISFWGMGGALAGFLFG
jgi:hypothetical protein